MINENLRDTIILIAIPLAAAAICAKAALASSTPSRAWRIGFFGVQGVGLLLAIAVGAFLDFQFAAKGKNIDIPAVVLLPFFELVVCAIAGLFAGATFAAIVRRRT
jgi:hypothetical protein